MQRAFTSFLSIFSSVIFGCLIPLTVEAQVTPDGTTSTTVNQDGNNFIIEQGDRINDNLFHSFDEFSVPTLGSAAFNNAGDIANIFSRVTGSNISSIDGLISANGAANLFLINPNGIIFGENASLNLGGSFFASTADSLLFENGSEFSASNPQAAPLLEVSIPIGISFRDNPGDITVQSNNDSLILPTEETIALIGGNITFDGADIFVPGLTVELGGLSETGTVSITESGSLSFPENITQADISLLNNSRISVSSSGGGFITINGENLEIAENSSLLAGIAPESSNAAAQAGNITININNEIALSDNSFIFNAVSDNAAGNGGNLDIKTSSLSVNNNSGISTTTLGNGASGQIVINADDISLNGDESFISTGVNSNGVGNGGDLNISANSLVVTDGTINSGTIGQGNSGAIEIDAQDIFIDQGTIFTAVGNNGVGNAGKISISTSSLTLVNGTTVNGGTFGQGNAGVIDINANNILFDNIIISSAVGENAIGNGENLEITTKSLNIVNGTQINNSIVGNGNGGDVNIVAEEEVRIAGVRDSGGSGLGLAFEGTPTTVVSAIGIGAEGNGGNINISAGNLTIEDGAGITTSNAGNGIGGDINLDIRGDIVLQGRTPVEFNDLDFNLPSSIQTATGAGALFGVETSGQAGNINIQANSLLLNDNSLITSLTATNQDAGNISIQTDDLVSLNNSSIDSSVSPGAEGIGGNIDIRTSTLNLTSGGQIDGQVNGEFLDNPGGIGRGGNISIDASESVNISGFRAEEPAIFNPLNPLQTQLVGLDSSGIFVSTQAGATGQAGTITVNTGELNLVDSGIIEAVTANSSDAGDIEVNVNTLNAIGGGQIIATTFSEGKAGNIIINSDNEVILSGSDPTFAERLAQRPDVISNQGADSGIFANTTIDSTGIGGSIFISNPQQLTIEDGAKISVNSLGQGNGGNLSVQTDSVSLNQGLVSASTESGEGGNITLQIDDDLLLRNDSTISAQAANDANGGNATISTELVIAFPDGNNDIIANAERGNGGNINITAESLFGIEERPLNPFTNDINASSEFGLQGDIAINTPEVDPTSGLIELPQAVGDASDQISQNPCEQGVGSEFTITGKGGLPPNVNESLNSESAQVELMKPLPQPLSYKEKGARVEANSNSTENSTAEFVPAMGWVFNEHGEVTLTAYSISDQEIQRSGQQHQTTCKTGISD